LASPRLTLAAPVTEPDTVAFRGRGTDRVVGPVGGTLRQPQWLAIGRGGWRRVGRPGASAESSAGAVVEDSGAPQTSTLPPIRPADGMGSTAVLLLVLAGLAGLAIGVRRFWRVS
jgi:hypothetical protein